MSNGTIFMSGDPDCKLCGGRGVVRVESDESVAPVVEPCKCVLIKRLRQNVNRGWKGLLSAPRIDDSPLMEVAEGGGNLWVTSPTPDFRAHLRYAAHRMGPAWGFQVVTDSDLMCAWLASAKLEGVKILDPEVAANAASVSVTKISLPDLVIPPEVLVIVLGVKAARNSAMPEVLYEALNLRLHEQKPVWIVDQPHNRLAVGHRAFDAELSTLLDGFPYMKLDGSVGASGGGRFSAPEALPESQPAQSKARVGWFGNGHGNTSTSSVDTQDPKAKRGKRGGNR